jgi:hypothetical protein
VAAVAEVVTSRIIGTTSAVEAVSARRERVDVDTPWVRPDGITRVPQATSATHVTPITIEATI